MIGLKRGTVELLPYDPTWAAEFEQEKTRLRAVFGDEVPIEHIGSTAVPGLSAKPLIDMQVGLETTGEAAKFIPSLLAMGYNYFLERDHGDEIFMPKGPEEFRTHYLHITSISSDRWRNTLLFRDYLRTHPEAMRDYEHLKQELMSTYADKRELYTAAKTDFIHDIVQKAFQ